MIFSIYIYAIMFLQDYPELHVISIVIKSVSNFFLSNTFRLVNIPLYLPSYWTAKKKLEKKITLENITQGKQNVVRLFQ